MTNTVSETLNRLSESATLAMARKSREMKAEGIDVISLSLGEPDFDTPDFIKAAAIEGIEQNYTHYPPVNGYLDLREALSAKFKRDNNIDYSPDQIVVSTGAKQSLANVVMSLVSSGEEVILPAPYWVSYSEIVKMADGIPVVIPTSIENDFKISPAELEAAITDKTRMMIYSSPCNPTGTTYTTEELEALAKVIEKHPRLIVISDEIYELINFDAEAASLARIDKIYNQVVTVNGVAKGFSMTGWRIGYIGAPLWIAQACTKLQGQVTSGASTISQRATIAAVNANPEVVSYMKDAFIKRRELMYNRLKNIPNLKVNKPGGAFYFFPDISGYFGKSDGSFTINNADDLTNYILEKGRVALVTGEAFGDPKCIRISYAASEADLNKAMDRIEACLAQLN